MSTTTDYGEPWTFEDEGDDAPLRTVHEMPIVCGNDYEIDPEKLKRAVVCTNACAGIPDPESAITAAREVLEYYVGCWNSGAWSFGNPDKAFAALKLLTPPTK